MARFRKKPVVIEAEQWHRNGDVYPVLIHRGHEPGASCRHCSKTLDEHGWINTLEGGHIVCPGDWIITGVDGEKYPCKPDIFAKTYDCVESESRLDIAISFRFTIGQLVKYAHGSAGQHWHGRVCAIESYTDVNGTRVFYHVRWIDPAGCPSRDTHQLPAEELEAA